MSIDRACQYHVDVGETSLVGIVSHDLVPAMPGIELLVATSDGTLLCLAAGNASQSTASQASAGVMRELARITAWPAERRSHNDFVFSDTVSSILCLSVFPLWVTAATLSAEAGTLARPNDPESYQLPSFLC